MRKLGLIFLLYFLFSLNLYAFDANIMVTKEEIGLNDNTKLRIRINHDNKNDIEIKEIKGIDNFLILNKTSGTSSSSNIVIIDGKTSTQSQNTDFIDLTLSPKKSGSFDIGPAIIESNNEKKETNIVKVNVSESYKKNHNNEDFKNRDDFNNFLFLIFLVIISLGLILYFKKDLFNSIIKKYKNSFIKTNDKVKEEPKEVEPNTIIDFPPIDDENFVNNINKIFINKIKSKYYIENIEKKSNEEIYSYIPDDLSDKENIGKIIFILNKLKYSNQDIDKNEIIELLKSI